MFCRVHSGTFIGDCRFTGCSFGFFGVDFKVIIGNAWYKNIRNKNEQYWLDIVGKVPTTPVLAPISGISVTCHIDPGNGSLSYWLLYILFQTRVVQCYEIRRSDQNPLIFLRE
jgi:hypothetical protein